MDLIIEQKQGDSYGPINKHASESLPFTNNAKRLVSKPILILSIFLKVIVIICDNV